MLEFFENLFNTDGFPARWHCGNWEAGHGWLHIISDSLISLAYILIPVALLFFTWRKHREILFARIVWLFAAFILFCGIGHLIEAVIFWHPVYRFAGLIKAFTAFVSWATLLAIIFKMPLALKVPGLITVNRELERLLVENENTTRDLVRSNEDLDQFAYVASHDLKAPLRSIRNLAEWIKEDCGEVLPEESRRHLSQIQSRIGRLDSLLNDLLTYSRAGRDLLDAETFPLEGVITKIISDLAGTDFRFTFALNLHVKEIKTWRVPFEQIMRNLISNAMKHHGGERGRIEISSRLVEDTIEIHVSDDGQGIPVEFQERIFGMFQTLRSKDEIEGAGMGLAIVSRVLERLNGSITCHSREGEGATFVVVLPHIPVIVS